INMVPMIDLMVSCIAFLLITAVWSHMARLALHADVPGRSDDTLTPRPPERVLHVDAKDPSIFTLSWRQGTTVLSSMTVPRRPTITDESSMRFPDLAAAIVREQTENGMHRDADERASDLAVIHTGNSTPARELVAIVDAVSAPLRGQRAAGDSE